MNKIRLTASELDLIKDIVLENKLGTFALLCDNSSGIGATIDLQFECEMNGRDATVSIPISGAENW